MAPLELVELIVPVPVTVTLPDKASTEFSFAVIVFVPIFKVAVLKPIFPISSIEPCKTTVPFDFVDVVPASNS